MIEEISPSDAKKLIDENKEIKLLDVRERWEYNISHIQNSILIPLSEFNSRFNELNPDDNIIVVCHHGVRSYRVTEFLLSKGFKKVKNLQGGIDAWSQQVDPSIPLY
jgi:rhodanese-related sulfurtransferase